MKRWEDPIWVEEMRLELDYNLMMAPPLDPRSGIVEEEIRALAPRFREIHQDLSKKRSEDQLPFLTIPFHPSLAQEIRKYSRQVKGWVENFVVLGIGGSALGAKALQTALNHPHHNLLSRTMRKGVPRLFVCDNIDPDGFKALLDLIDVRKTLFNVISKSGGTAETMSQFLIVRELLKKRLGNRSEADHLVITTDPAKGILRQIAQDEQIVGFSIPPLLGGRFSVLSAVGLLPAAMVGIDISELLAGAREMERRCRAETIQQNPAYLCAALAYLAYQKKQKNIRVFMPYVDALKDVGQWFVQLWAESLGKRLNRRGEEIWVGQTPVVALGATDQHSQLQLYLEGPADKVLTFVGVKNYDGLQGIPKLYPEAEALAYLGGHSLNKLIQAELQATRMSLAKSNRPGLLITLPRINPFTVGQLLFLLELETYLCGQLQEIDPLDQPGVEQGKVLAYALLGRKGFEDQIRGWGPFMKSEGKHTL
jgi:glucose-6-phosphate isomerase